jgi:hypothetical protein
MMRCVLHQAKVAAQAVIARKVDQEPCPQPEEVAHALDQPSPPPTIEEVCCDVFSLPSGCCDVFSLPSGCCDVFSLPSECCDVFFLPSGCCDVFSPLSSSCNVFSTSPKHRMMLCVLSLTQAAAQEVTVKKVDQHAPPPPEEVDDDVHDRLEVTDEQGGRGLAVSVFLLSHIGFILRRFSPQVLFPSISYLGKLLSLLLLHPSPTTLLHTPQPSLHIRTATVWLLCYTPRPCVRAVY